jgi:UDP-N-acetylmuramate dehydrogenase
MYRMQILHDVPLGLHSTMRLGGKAANALEIHNPNEIHEATIWAKRHDLPIIMIGSGSNIVWRDEGFKGLLLINKISGYEVFDEDQVNYFLTVGGGEAWDEVVSRSTEAGASGIEALSLIPGTAGATPVQNVGAYGQEIAQVLVSLEAYDLATNSLVMIPAADCDFSYRKSRFNTQDKGRFLITSITLHLLKTKPAPPFYEALQTYLDEYQIYEFTPQVIRDAVIAIRSAKLPDVTKVANNGSFFANPIISEEELSNLKLDYPAIKYWQQSSGKVKLSAAWLIEQAGFKAFKDSETGMATWPKQSLVLVNEQAKSTADLLKFKQKMIDAVWQRFKVTLTQEPELLP